MQETNGILVDYAFIAQKADVNFEGLLNVEKGGVSRLVIGSFSKDVPLVFVARVRAETAKAPIMYTCRVIAESPSGEGGRSYGDVHAYVAVREGGFFVLPITMQIEVPGEHRLKLQAYLGNASSDAYGDYASSEWPVIADLPLFIQ